jgi:hypothetical protein
MATDFTVILFQRQHFGNQPNLFNDAEPNVPFVGPTKDFSFNCPRVDPGETAFLMFQSRFVSHNRNVFQINGVGVFGGLPAGDDVVNYSVDQPQNLLVPGWQGNILLIEPHHQLRETGNVLHVGSLEAAPGRPTDDFIIDNVVLVYKTRKSEVSTSPRRISGKRASIPSG